MVNPKSSTTPKAVQETLKTVATEMGKSMPNDKDQINTGSGRQKDDVKNDARSAYGDAGRRSPRRG